MRSVPDPLSIAVNVCFFCFCTHTYRRARTHTLFSQPSASQTPCPFSENTTCVTKAANLLSTAVSPVWRGGGGGGGRALPQPITEPLWSHSNPLSRHSTKINHYSLIGLLLCSVLLCSEDVHWSRSTKNIYLFIFTRDCCLCNITFSKCQTAVVQKILKICQKDVICG